MVLIVKVGLIVITNLISYNNCLDYDECVQNEGICSYQCKNTLGSYICLCPDGFQLNNDLYNCDSKLLFLWIDKTLTHFVSGISNSNIASYSEYEMSSKFYFAVSNVNS